MCSGIFSEERERGGYKCCVHLKTVSLKGICPSTSQIELSPYELTNTKSSVQNNVSIRRYKTAYPMVHILDGS